MPGVRNQEGQTVERRHTLDVRACADKVQGLIGSAGSERSGDLSHTNE